MIENHPDITTSDILGLKSIHFAACRKNPEFIKVLLNTGANLNANKYSVTPLELARNYKNDMVITAHIKAESDTKCKK